MDAGRERDDVLTFEEVAALLRLSRRQMHRLQSAGRLPRPDCTLGTGPRGRRWLRSRILAWVAAGAQAEF